MFPAALITILPSAVLPFCKSSSSRIISFRKISRCSSDSSVNSKTLPLGILDLSNPNWDASHIFTLSREPLISWFITAELVVTPSIMPFSMSSAIRLVTPSCKLGPLPVTTTTLPAFFFVPTTFEMERSRAFRERSSNSL